MREAGLQGAYLRRRWRAPSTRQASAGAPARTWSNATSPPPRRTGSGSPTPPASRAARACSGWPRCATCSPTASSGGRPRIAATPSSSWARSSTACGPAMSATANCATTPTAARTSGSRGRRNTSTWRCLVGRAAGWMTTRTGRPAMRSPGRPPVRRDVERAFWRKIAEGLSSEDAAVACGVSAPVGTRWFREAWRHAVDRAGRAVGSVSVVRRARGDRDAESPEARRPRDRTPTRPRSRRRSRGSCAATPQPAAASWTTAPRRRSGMPSGPRSRPKTAKLAANDRLREYVQDRLAGMVASQLE